MNEELRLELLKLALGKATSLEEAIKAVDKMASFVEGGITTEPIESPISPKRSLAAFLGTEPVVEEVRVSDYHPAPTLKTEPGGTMDSAGTRHRYLGTNRLGVKPGAGERTSMKRQEAVDRGFAQHNKRWTDEEKQAIADLFDGGEHDLVKLAEASGRTPKSISTAFYSGKIPSKTWAVNEAASRSMREAAARRKNETRG